jgi:hypothetical protein
MARSKNGMVTPSPSPRSNRGAVTRRPLRNHIAQYAFNQVMRNPYVRTGYQVAQGAKKGLQLYQHYKPFVKPFATPTVQRPIRKAMAHTGGKGSASNSKAAGKFTGARKVTTQADRFAAAGFVKKMEFGGQVVDSGRQVVYIAHSTMPAQQVTRVMISALLKKLLNIAQHRVKSEDEAIIQGQYYNSEVVFSYKLRDGGIIQEQKFVVGTSTTLADLSQSVFAWIFGLSETVNLPGQFLVLRYFVEFGTTVTARMLQAELDLTTVSFSFYSKSHLKIQNRTVNSDGNDQADDVDNVPLYGKFFDYNSNGTIYRDYNDPSTATSSAITTSPVYGLLPSTIGSDTSTKMYVEVPDRTQFVGCQKVGKSNLDPGEIKTSTITTNCTFSMGKLITTLLARKPNSTQTTTGQPAYNQIWIGKTRLFSWEKMINSVAMTAVNQFNLAFEHQLEIGCIVSVKRSNYTAPAIQQIAPVTVT